MISRYTTNKMTKYKNYILLTMILNLLSCAQKIELSDFEGYYEYYNIDPNNFTIIDTVRTKAIFTNYASDGLPVIEIDILDNILFTKGSLLGLWDVREINNKLIPEYFSYVKSDVKIDDTWEKGYGNRFIKQFKCISLDTTIIINRNIKIKCNKYIRETTKNEGWDIRDIAYDNKYKIVFYSHYLKYLSGERTPKQIFILKDFIPKDNFPDTTEANIWLKQKPLKLNHRLGYLPEDEYIDFEVSELEQ